MNSQGVAGYPPSPYIVNLIELQNTINNASGTTTTSALANAVADIQKMVNFQKKQVNTNFLASYDSNSISVLSNMNFIGAATLSVDGTEVTGGGGGSAGDSLVAGRTSITLQARSSPAISMNIQRRPIFTFSQIGNGLFYDASGIATQFRISSARLIADTVGFSGVRMAPAAGKFLYSTDTCGNAVWSIISTIQANNTIVATNSADNSIRFTTNNIERARILTSGNFGIATTNPTTTLDVNGKTRTTTFQVTSGASPGYVLQATDSQGNAAWSNLTTTVSSIVNGTNNVQTNSANNSISFVTAGTSNMILTSLGQLGINTMSPSYDFEVNGTAYASELTTGALNTNTVAAVNITTTGVTASIIRALYTNTTYISSQYGVLLLTGALETNDPITCVNNITANNFFTFSDSNLKNNIRCLECSEADGVLETLEGVRFKWNESGKEDIGMIAQKVQSVLPEAVQETDYGLAMAYQKLIPVLVESMKGLKRRVGSLEEEIAEIKRKLP